MKRDIFAELTEGFSALADERQGKITLRKHSVEVKPALEVGADDIVQVREKLHMSQPVFANMLRTSVKTLQNWEQGRSKPNAQAAVLIKLVDQEPKLLEQLAALA